MSISAAQRIKALEDEIRSLRKQALTRREPNKGFGGVIQRIREGQGLTVSELADRSGISKGLLSKLERQTAPKIQFQTLVKIAEGLNLSPSLLVSAYEDR